MNLELHINHCLGTTDHIRHPPDTASLPVIITIDPSQKLTFPTTGILFQISISIINLNVRIISEASLVKKIPELESTLKKTLKKSQVLSSLTI